MTALSRDYRLTGPENELAFERGLAEAAWWRPPIDDARLTELMQRTNARAARDTILWLGLIVGLAVVIVLTWFSWYSVPLLIAYGALYGGASDSRWHECGHGTAFRWLVRLSELPEDLRQRREGDLRRAFEAVRHLSKKTGD